MRSPALKEAIRLIQTNEAIYLGTHVRPDGDALGSLLALALALEQTGHRVAPLCADPVPPAYQFLPNAARVCSEPPPWSAQLGIALDCDGISRLGGLAPSFANLPRLIDIDHHATDHGFGDVRLIDSSAAATAEIVYQLLGELGIELDADAAVCLYTAILTDTGRFCFGNTTAGSLRTATALVDAGADPHSIARKVYEERSMEGTHLLGRALSRLSADFDSQVVSVTLSGEDFRETGARPSDTEGIIDHLRAIGGPRVALLFVALDDNQVRVSLRSDGTVDVSEIALGFGGGGHAMAAGCTVPGQPHEVRERVLGAVVRALPGSQLSDAR